MFFDIFSTEKKLKDMTPREEMELELQEIERDVKWYDMKLRNEHGLSAEQKLDLLKKKWAIQIGLKNRLF